MLKCQNNACKNREYLESENHDKACTHHPGGPVFHDAKKGWSCCQKRVYDFSEFLELLGCTQGRHNNIKPKDREAPKPSPDIAKRNEPEQPAKPVDAPEHKIPEMAERDPKNYGTATVIKAPPLAHEMEKLIMERPSANSDLRKMQFKTSANLPASIQKARLKIEEEKKNSMLGDKAQIAAGTPCFRAGCTATYPNYGKCCYHPGAPVFHEGLKFWDCCQRKTTDFNSFLRQEGCTTRSEHKWTGIGGKNIMNVRHDFFQHGDNAVITIFAKNALVETLTVEANAVAVHVAVEYEAGLAKIEFSVELFGMVDLDHRNTKITVAPQKIELQFRKQQLIKWAQLQMKDTEIIKVVTSLEKEDENGVEANTSKQDDYDCESSDIDDFLSARPEKEVTLEESEKYFGYD